MKLFVERTLPMMDPLAAQPQFSPFEKMPRVVTLSVCGFWEQSMFEAMSLTWACAWEKTLIAEIYRPSAEFLSVPEFQPQVQAVLDAVAQPGKRWCARDRSARKTLADLTQDLAPADTLMRLAGNSGRQAAAGNQRVEGKRFGGGGKGREPIPPPQTPTPNPIGKNGRGRPAGSPLCIWWTLSFGGAAKAKKSVPPVQGVGRGV